MDYMQCINIFYKKEYMYPLKLHILYFVRFLPYFSSSSLHFSVRIIQEEFGSRILFYLIRIFIYLAPYACSLQIKGMYNLTLENIV